MACKRRGRLECSGQAGLLFVSAGDSVVPVGPLSPAEEIAHFMCEKIYRVAFGGPFEGGSCRRLDRARRANVLSSTDL